MRRWRPTVFGVAILVFAVGIAISALLTALHWLLVALVLIVAFLILGAFGPRTSVRVGENSWAMFHQLPTDDPGEDAEHSEWSRPNST